MPEVVLLCMPYAAIERPSIALGTLQALLRRDGIESRALYANLRFAERIDVTSYAFYERAFGDLTFSHLAFPDHRPRLSAFLDLVFHRLRHEYSAIPALADRDGFKARLASLRETAADLVEETARQALASGAPIVGCTSMYWQHTASLAVLRRVRTLDPSRVTLLGGANCESVMGLATHRNFPWVDYVVSGEADDFIAALCRRLLASGRDVAAHELPEGVFGPVHRSHGYPRVGTGDGVPRATSHGFVDSPPPLYEDYFTALDGSDLAAQVRPGLLVETARGCWYGARRQCKFCGISEAGMIYTSKPPQRVLDEIRHLEKAYGVSHFEVTDNILDMSYFQTVLPQLAAAGRRRSLFWETKANLKRRHLEALVDAGVRWIQPGIESLDTRTLGLMNKGVRGSHNVMMLKDCRELGIRVAWNWLWGFPGEDDGWYFELAEKVPRLHHLQPPRLILRIRVDRYSPYQTDAAAYRLELRPMSFMAAAYPLPPEELMDLTYYFEVETVDGRPPRPLTQRPGTMALYRAVRRWKRRFWSALPPVLTVEDDGRTLRFLDTRDAAPRRHELRGRERSLYLACDGAPRRDHLLARFPDDDPAPRIDELLRQGLLCELDGRLLPLALAGPVPRLPPGTEFPGGVLHPRRERQEPAVGLSISGRNLQDAFWPEQASG